MRISCDICIIGGGPAGSVLGTKLARLGFDVCLVERAAFPRRHLGESLSPGVLPLLATVGASRAVTAAGFTPVRTVTVDWDRGPTERRDPDGQGLLVDRGQFDLLLLDHARAAGVRVLQPATLRARRFHDDGWNLRIESAGRAIDVRAGFLADASGRAAARGAGRRQAGARTLALFGYWEGNDLPVLPRIQAGDNEWFWGVPIPDGTYNTLVFVDALRLRRGGRASVDQCFRQMIDRSSLLAGSRNARLTGPVAAVDATPYRDEECVTPRRIKVGDAALALDPLSSSGVQKAIQTALSGAIVVNTLLRDPAMREAALGFYRTSLHEASERHRRWAAQHYATAAVGKSGAFWCERSAIAAEPPAAAPLEGKATDILAFGEVPLTLTPGLEFVDLPCIEGTFVRVKTALRHPRLETPVAFLGDWELAPLVREIRAGMTTPQIIAAWDRRVPPEPGRAITGWLISRGLLAPQPDGRVAAPERGRSVA